VERRLEGKVALVTGASRGIGYAVAERLVAEGARVCVTARKPEPLAAAVDTLGGSGTAIGVAGKADDPEHQAAAIAATVEAFGGLDILVNNTGINPVFGRLVDTDPAALRKIFEVNTIAAISWTRQSVAAGLGEREGAAVVNMASIAGLGVTPGLGAYGASKAALMHVTAQVAAELAPAVRVNAVAPAVVKTTFAAALYEGREDQVAAGYPLGRLGVPADVAGAVAFLVSADASWITGQTLILDGGRTLLGGLE
jgi:NAD(P)-dependent dehydrogenase (short-subunit alcohol dehydrogenase family)